MLNKKLSLQLVYNFFAFAVAFKNIDFVSSSSYRRRLLAFCCYVYIYSPYMNFICVEFGDSSSGPPPTPRFYYNKNYFTRKCVFFFSFCFVNIISTFFCFEGFLFACSTISYRTFLLVFSPF